MNTTNVLGKESTTNTEEEQRISEVEYPESDGQPMGETGFHVIATFHLLQTLRQLFHEKTDVYVIADMFLYYEEGNPRACKAPDVMIIKGVENLEERRTFKTWEEDAVPCLIIEVTSKSTMFEDMVNKSTLYASLGIREYFLFDPLHEYIEESLVGFRLEDKKYLPIQTDDKGWLFSEELGTFLSPATNILQVIDPYTGYPIPALEEAISKAEQEAQRAEQEAQRAEQEAQRAEQEAQRAEQEAQRADAAEVEIARLRALLDQ